MNVLVIGSGGREHAIAWKLSKSKLLTKLFCAPGNPGTCEIAINLPISVGDFEGIKNAIIKNNIDLVVVGPEDPLVNGIRDFLCSDPSLKQLMIVGPDKRGATLEGSKDFAKSFMTKYSIPTASYKTFSREQENDAFEFLKKLNPPYVLKADGLAAGKGVLIVNDYQEACNELHDIFMGKFSDAGCKVVIEEFLSGIEVSVFVLTDGTDYMILPEAKDYKRIGDGDKGANTGGMGAVSPVPFANATFMKKVEERIIIPTIKGIQKEKMDYKGFIFIGLMNVNGDPYVIEYNVRMGDPETEAVMARIDSDFLSHLEGAAKGELKKEKIMISNKSAVTTVLVSKGYPGSYQKGFEIKGFDDLRGVSLFHSGTKKSGDKIVTNGGRVLAMTALGEDIQEARNLVYCQINKIYFEGATWRNDIAVDLLKANNE